MNADGVTWKTATAGQRVLLVLINIVEWAVIFPLMILGGLFMLGTMVDGISDYKTQLSRCQKHAVTPYEYHQCKG